MYWEWVFWSFHLAPLEWKREFHWQFFLLPPEYAPCSAFRRWPSGSHITASPTLDGALSQEVNKVSCGSISCTISNKPQARICSGCRRNIGVVGNFSEWDAINTEYSLSPSVNSDLLENECSRTIIWKCADLRPILSPKEILIWTFYTEFRQAWKLHTAGSKPSLGNFSPI